MGIELRQLRYFVAVAEELSITRAAGRLFLSQQALSAAVRQLEQRAGTELLVRGPRGLELTGPGQTLLDYARDVLHGADELEAALRAHRDGREGVLRVGLLTDGAGPLTAPIIAAFRAARPRVEVVVRTIQPNDGVDRLLDGRIDVALLHGPQAHAGIDVVPLFTQPRVVAVAAGSPLADAPELAAAALLDQRVATRNPAVPVDWEGFFTLREERGEEPERVGEPASSFDEVLWNIALNDVVLTLPAHLAVAHPGAGFGIRYVPVPDLAPVTYSLAVRREHHSPTVSAFRTAALNAARQLIGLIPGAQLPSSPQSSPTRLR